VISRAEVRCANLPEPVISGCNFLSYGNDETHSDSDDYPVYGGGFLHDYGSVA
jgi:hypothetical protein